mmetsp:Transcript_35000/g.56198  ORF Transcript_35000/g.56198 Transcript_35000/m.56198 type:complete len:301 (+) Transcript_35000:204-1106(+)
MIICIIIDPMILSNRKQIDISHSSSIFLMMFFMLLLVLIISIIIVCDRRTDGMCHLMIHRLDRRFQQRNLRRILHLALKFGDQHIHSIDILLCIFNEIRSEVIHTLHQQTQLLSEFINRRLQVIALKLISLGHRFEHTLYALSIGISADGKHRYLMPDLLLLQIVRFVQIVLQLLVLSALIELLALFAFDARQNDNEVIPELVAEELLVLIQHFLEVCVEPNVGAIANQYERVDAAAAIQVVDQVVDMRVVLLFAVVDAWSVHNHVFVAMRVRSVFHVLHFFRLRLTVVAHDEGALVAVL